MSEVQQLLARVPAGISLAEVARLADIHPNALSNIATGRRPATDLALGRIRLALARLRARQTKGPLAHVACYRGLLVLSAQALGLDPARAQAADPARNDRGPRARAISFARWLAQYLMNVTLGFKQVEVAKASGVTKAAVSLAMQEIELRRETDAAFNATLMQLEAHLVGEDGGL